MMSYFILFLQMFFINNSQDERLFIKECDFEMGRKYTHVIFKDSTLITYSHSQFGARKIKMYQKVFSDESSFFLISINGDTLSLSKIKWRGINLFIKNREGEMIEDYYLNLEKGLEEDTTVKWLKNSLPTMKGLSETERKKIELHIYFDYIQKNSYKCNILLQVPEELVKETIYPKRIWKR